jgi:hypothetical protein
MKTREQITSEFLDDYRFFCSGTALTPFSRSGDCYTLGYFASRCFIDSNQANDAGFHDLADKILRVRDAAHVMLSFAGQRYTRAAA